MKLRVLSDIHLEHWQFDYTHVNCDVVLLAGDIGPGFMGIDWINNEVTDDVPVCYIAGNHEFYGEPLWEHQARLAFRAKECDIDFLNNRTVVHNGVRIIGSTLWTDFNLHNTRDIAMLNAPRILSDYNAIDVEDDEMFSGQITPAQILNEHEYSLKYIISQLEQPFDGKTVVMTHHAPSELSIEMNYRSTKYPPYYASRLENVMLMHAPALWIHGHIHASSDYMVGDTRVIANPRGSKAHPNPNFDPLLIVEI
jgi:Icc-related predicted phosphoesterase